MSKIEGGQKVRKDIPRVVRLWTVVVTIELLFEPYLWTATAKIQMASKSNLFYAFYVVHNLLSIYIKVLLQIAMFILQFRISGKKVRRAIFFTSKYSFL